MIKQISFIYRPPGISPREFRQYWKEFHTEIVKRRLPGLRKYVGNFPVDVPRGEKLPGGGAMMDCDAVVELHFDDMDSYTKAMTGPLWLDEERRKSSLRILDFTRVHFTVVEEFVVPL